MALRLQEYNIAMLGYGIRLGLMFLPDFLPFGDSLRWQIVVREAAAWYRIEPSARMRRDMLTFIRFEDMQALKPLYEVGVKDWDTDNANLAKEQLELLRSTRGSAGGGGTPSSRRGKPNLWGPAGT